MAKNYTIKEAVEIIAKGTDLEAIAELGKRFPVLTTKIAVVAAKAGSDFVDFMGYMPEHLTANKVNTVIKNGISSDVEDTDEEEDVEGTETPAPKKAKAKAEAADVDTTWNEDMSGKELVKLIRKAGKGGLIKSKKKADLIELCKELFGAPNAAEVEVDEDEVEETEVNLYEGMTAMELFKECKKRGLKAESKKKAKYYIDLLTKDDAKADEAPVEDDDDWGDDEEVEETPAPVKEPKKTSKKAEKKAEKKAAKKVEEADDDDDWDI